MRNSNSTLIFILAITILSIVVFVGCSPMKTSNNSIAITKTFYLGTLKTLVSDKTILQTQSNQVLAEVLRNVNESKGYINGLNDLVESGVITKPQADTINQKIQITMKHDMESK